MDKEDVTPPLPEHPEQIVQVEHVGPVPLSKARQIYRSIAQYFGGQTQLDEPARKKRATDAARARWDKDK